MRITAQLVSGDEILLLQFKATVRPAQLVTLTLPVTIVILMSKRGPRGTPFSDALHRFFFLGRERTRLVISRPRKKKRGEELISTKAAAVY